MSSQAKHATDPVPNAGLDADRELLPCTTIPVPVDGTQPRQTFWIFGKPSYHFGGPWKLKIVPVRPFPRHSRHQSLCYSFVVLYTQNQCGVDQPGTVLEKDLKEIFMQESFRLEAIATGSRLEAIASRLEAVASRLEAVASRLEAIASNRC